MGKKKKHTKHFCFNGKREPSFIADLKAEVRSMLRCYYIIAISIEQERIIASELTDHNIQILFSKHHAQIWIEDKELGLGVVPFRGQLVLTLISEADPNTIGFMFVDTTNETCKTFSMDMYGFDMELVMPFLGNVFKLLRQTLGAKDSLLELPAHFPTVSNKSLPAVTNSP